MDAVRDDPDDRLVIVEQRPGQAGLPVVQRRHRVEQVRSGPRPVQERDSPLIPARAGMAERHHHSLLAEPLYDLQGPGQLGRERQHPHRPQPQECLDLGPARRSQVLDRMRAVVARGEPRPLQVHSERPGAPGRPLRQVRQHCRILLPGECHHGGEEGGHAVAQQAPPGRLEVGGRVREVLPEGAVDLDVDQPGDDPAALGVERPGRSGTIPGLDRGDPPLADHYPRAGPFLLVADDSADEFEISGHTASLKAVHAQAAHGAG